MQTWGGELDNAVTADTRQDSSSWCLGHLSHRLFNRSMSFVPMELGVSIRRKEMRDAAGHDLRDNVVLGLDQLTLMVTIATLEQHQPTLAGDSHRRCRGDRWLESLIV